MSKRHGSSQSQDTMHASLPFKNQKRIASCSSSNEKNKDTLPQGRDPPNRVPYTSFPPGHGGNPQPIFRPGTSAPQSAAGGMCLRSSHAPAAGWLGNGHETELARNSLGCEWIFSPATQTSGDSGDLVMHRSSDLA